MSEGMTVSELMETLVKLRDNGLPGTARVVLLIKEDGGKWPCDVVDVHGRVDITLDEAGPVEQLFIEGAQL